MEQGGTQTIATFTGTLLHREHTLGQRFVQLVFRENDKNWLCISSKLTNTSLEIGQDYRIEGIFRQKGSHAYIHEPRITLSKKHWSLLKRGVVLAISLACITGLGGAAFALHGHAPAATNVSTQSTTPAPAKQTTAPTAATQPASPEASTPTPPQAPAVTAPPKKTTTSTTKVTTPPPVAAPTPQPTAPAVVTSDCDAIVVTPFATQTIEDDTQAVGYSQVTQAGVNGQTQTCYPNGRSAAGVTTTIASEVDQITTVGPPAP